MIGPARAYARQRARLGFAARRGNITNRKHEILRREEYDPDVAVLMSRIAAG